MFADIWCPFTHAGLHLFDEHRRRSGRADVTIVVHAWPLELVNGAPMDAEHVLQRATSLREQVVPGLFRHVDVDHFPATTLPALALEARAHRADAATGERASFALRDALFERGEDIADMAVLGRIAADLGVGMPDDDDHAAVLTSYGEGQRRGVRGSPHFFCNLLDVFCPSLEITRDAAGDLSIKPDAARLTAFFEECLAS